MFNYFFRKLLILLLLNFTLGNDVRASDDFSYLEDREFGKVTGQTFVNFEEDKRLDLYDRLLEQKDVQPRLTKFIDDLFQINQDGDLIFEVGLNLRSMMRKTSETDLKNFLSRKAAECVINAYLRHYKSSQSVVVNYFKRAKPILDKYSENNPEIFKLLIDIAQQGWCKS